MLDSFRMTKILVSLFTIVFLASCETDKLDAQPFKDLLLNPILDEDTGLHQDELFQKKRKNQDKESKYKDKLDLTSIVVPPQLPPLGNGQLISISVTEEVPIKDIFVELSRLADIDIKIDADINFNVIFRVVDKPIEIVIKNLCELANLKYEYKDGILHISRDIPYLKDYNVDIISTDELWTSMEASLKNILETYNTYYNNNIERLRALQINARNISEAQNSQDENNGQGTASQNLSTTDLYSTENFKLDINKPAGILSVYADAKTHNIINAYIEKAKFNYGTQVLIEAKVVEVKLKKEFRAGINWNIVKNRDVFVQNGSGEDAKILKAQQVGRIFNVESPGALGLRQREDPAGLAGIQHLIDHTRHLRRNSSETNFTDLNIIVDAMEEFGTTRTLSSPRVHALNNQTAVLDFVTKLVYFSVEKEEEEDTETGKITTTYTSTKEEAETGVKLNITPSINPITREITLKVTPELITKIGEVEDPNPDMMNVVPILQTRKIETSLKINSGDVMVIGGLMSEESTNVEGGIPVLRNLPILGWAFKYKQKARDITETVIFIKATIVDKNDSLNDNYRNFYLKYNTDNDDYIN